MTKMVMRRKPEVLAPAGNLRGLKTAVDYGADAVYCGGKAFGMRSAPKNLSLEDFEEGARYAHERGSRVYVTCNILPRNDEIKPIERYLGDLRDTGVDALIVTDIGVLMMARRIVPELELHVSTQAGVTNYLAANALYELGARRVVLAREMDLQAVRDIRANIPDDLDIETFVHGSMCMAFSGRCLISNYLTGRDGNHGECAQPCRWKYSLVEEKRPGQVFPIEETSAGTYLFNSQDMCLMEHLDEVIDSGATSLKIEGRAKSAYYIAAMTNAYKTAVNEYMVQRGFEAPDGTVLKPFQDRVVRAGDADSGGAAEANFVDSVMLHADQAFSGMPGMDEYEGVPEEELASGEEPESVNDGVAQARVLSEQRVEEPEPGKAGEAQDGFLRGRRVEEPEAKDASRGQARFLSERRVEEPELAEEPEGFVHAGVRPAPKVVLPQWLHEEPYKVAHRDYSTGFYFPEEKVTQNTDRSAYFRDWLVVGEVLSWSPEEGGRVTLMSRNKIVPGQLVEFLLPGQAPLEYIVPDDGLRDAEGLPVAEINNPAHVFSMPCPVEVPVNAAMRSKTKKKTLKAA